MFNAGDLVICINDEWRGIPGITSDPKKGEIYTVRESMSNQIINDGVEYIRLKEIMGVMLGSIEDAYSAGCFKKVIDYKEMMSRKTEVGEKV